MGISQAAFADRIGAHRSCYGAVERRKTDLTRQTIERIASEAGVEPTASSASVRLACSGETEVAA
jgi:transcriptional regulator with XRE-family HTH domain